MSQPRPELEDFLHREVEAGRFSALAGLVGSSRGVAWSAGAGLESSRPRLPASAATVFDLGSLAKPFVATLALRLDSYHLPLATRLAEIWETAEPGLGKVSLQDLLRHRSGLPPWSPLYHLCTDRQEALAALLATRELAAKPGTYSDLGYILWGFAAEEVLREPLWRLLNQHLLLPLRCKTVRASPGAVEHAAVCGIDTAKEVELASELGLTIEPLPPPRWGRVQDGNARFLGGLAGHAGLFGTVEDLWRLAAEWLRPATVLSREGVAKALGGPGRHFLGWMARQVKGAAGPALSATSFGHTGFPGGSLWIDPEADRISILLGHRSSPLSDLQPLRREWNKLVMAVR